MAGTKQKERLADHIWLEIQTLYEAGTGIRELSRKFKVPASTICFRATKNGWELGKIEQLINDKAKTINTLEKVCNDIGRSVKKEQLPIVENLVRQRAQVFESLTKTLVGNTNLAQTITKQTIEQLKTKEISLADASRINSTVVATVGNIARAMGAENVIAPETKDDNEEQQNGVVIYLPDNGRD